MRSLLGHPLSSGIIQWARIGREFLVVAYASVRLRKALWVFTLPPPEGSCESTGYSAANLPIILGSKRVTCLFTCRLHCGILSGCSTSCTTGRQLLSYSEALDILKHSCPAPFAPVLCDASVKRRRHSLWLLAFPPSQMFPLAKNNGSTT